MIADAIESLVVFTLGAEKCALPTTAVERVVRAVEITPCPGAPDSVLGLINVHGDIVPVFDLRVRFSIPPRELSVEDHIIVARTATRRVALVADAVLEVTNPPGSMIILGDAVPPEAMLFDGILKLGGNIVLIYDLDRFLSQEEERQLAHAMQGL